MSGQEYEKMVAKDVTTYAGLKAFVDRLESLGVPDDANVHLLTKTFGSTDACKIATSVQTVSQAVKK